MDEDIKEKNFEDEKIEEDNPENNTLDEEENLMEDTRGESNIGEAEKIIEKRKENIIKFFKNKQIWVLGILIIAVILGVYIRSMPMQDHNGRPGLWDITTNSWTLGPDLDPWLFTRYAETIVEEGSLPKIDPMRNVPRGFDTSTETQLLPYMIVLTHHISNLFYNANIEFAGDLFPVIMFALTIIIFFLFVREIFIRKSKESRTKANIISLISTFFMIVIPVFLSRTVAGIPEKESAAFFFMFLAFYLFLKAWKSEKIKYAVILGIFSGIATALMGLIWGGVIYIYVTIAVATLAAFMLDKVKKKEIMIYFSWVIIAQIITFVFSNKYSIKDFLTGLDTGLVTILFFIMIVDYLLWNTKISRNKFLNKIKLPKNIISIIIAFILLILLVSIFFGPDFIIQKIKDLNGILFNPITGRWNITVAENRQPYFTEWGSSFGPFIRNIPVLFWLFFIGSVVLFKKMLNKIKKKDSWVLLGLYILFFFGLVFSRYSGSSIFNGEDFLSKAFYYLTFLLLFGFLVYYYLKYHKENEKGFEKIDYEFLFLFVLFILCLFTARSAVRLIMVLAPIAPIFLGYLIVESVIGFKKASDETIKVILGSIMILIVVLSGFVFWNFYQSVKSQSYSYVPSYYNVQWQKAMQWVREETPEDSVFSHWWDYGYWVQSIGKRATVVDGGNAIVYWNYLMGRLVLTGDNQKDALDFLYSHDANYLLIDSSDLGKYTAFSSIGSDENYDRYSWIGSFLLDESQTQETKNQTLYVYAGGISLDEDLIINESGKEFLLPRQNAGVGAIILPVEKTEKGNKFQQPYIIAVYQGIQHKINLRYLYLGGELIDFEEGIEGTAYILPRLISQGQGISSNPIGAAIFISPRLMRGMLANIYLLDDPLEKYPSFELAHTETNLVIDDLRNQGLDLPEFIYYNGIQGPIKIWKINYTGNEEVKEEYLDVDSNKYLDWKL